MEYEKKEGLYLTKNEDATAENKQPLIRLSYISREGEFTDLGAFWKTKSGNGYIGKIADGASITFTGVDAENKKMVDEF